MQLIRPSIAALHPYVPGEQPQDAGWIKLNTNENPFLLPQVAETVAEAANDALCLYPDPLFLTLRRKLAERYGVPAEQIVCGNGSDDLLTLAVRIAAGEGDRVVFPDPSYTLYETLARIQNAFPVPVPLGERWELPVDALAAAGGRLTFVSNPNAPTGTAYALGDLRRLAKRCEGLLVIDEAYVDFGGETSLPLVADCENVLVLRTMSKSFGLAGVRLGYAFGAPAVIEAMFKVKDSYNVDRLSQVAGEAALDHYEAAMENARIIAERRERYAGLLHQRFGWHVWPSATNFLLADTSPRSAHDLHEQLKSHRILVRYFSRPRIENALRLTIGTEPDMEALVHALDSMLR